MISQKSKPLHVDALINEAKRNRESRVHAGYRKTGLDHTVTHTRSFKKFAVLHISVHETGYENGYWTIVEHLHRCTAGPYGSPYVDADLGPYCRSCLLRPHSARHRAVRIPAVSRVIILRPPPIGARLDIDSSTNEILETVRFALQPSGIVRVYIREPLYAQATILQNMGELVSPGHGVEARFCIPEYDSVILAY
jgi:hypothetical protein